MSHLLLQLEWNDGQCARCSSAGGYCLVSAHAAQRAGGPNTNARAAIPFGMNGKATSRDPYLIMPPSASETADNFNKNSMSLLLGAASTGGGGGRVAAGSGSGLLCPLALAALPGELLVPAALRRGAAASQCGDETARNENSASSEVTGNYNGIAMCRDQKGWRQNNLGLGGRAVVCKRHKQVQPQPWS